VRGLRTLPIRMKAHEASALDIAKRLQALDIVDTVFHPALANRLPPGLTGTSGLFSLTFREGIDIRAFADHLKLFKLGVSWGGHESLIVPGEVVLQQKAQPNSAHTFGIDARSVRLHVGLEGTEALWSDLEAAITAASEA
jgi:cystathionine beta-lyase/cystathionine gamma-synthase